MSTIRTYSELSKLETIQERFRYLKLDGVIGRDTFGFDRYLNQEFYRYDQDYKRARRLVIARDLGMDLGVEGFEIHGPIYVHHMNPITAEDILSHSEFTIDPEYLICCSYRTHSAIHYGDESSLPKPETLITRTPNDTCPWKR